MIGHLNLHTTDLIFRTSIRYYELYVKLYSLKWTLGFLPSKHAKLRDVWEWILQKLAWKFWLLWPKVGSHGYFKLRASHQRSSRIAQYKLLNWNIFPWNWKVKSQIRSYFTTGRLPPISSSWRQAPWDSRPAIFFDWTLVFLVLM
jgi:hypothetical protein